MPAGAGEPGPGIGDQVPADDQQGVADRDRSPAFAQPPGGGAGGTNVLERLSPCVHAAWVVDREQAGVLGALSFTLALECFLQFIGDLVGRGVQ